jgi:hypothetical protein
MNEEQFVPGLGAIVSPPDYRDIFIGQLGLPEDVPTSYFEDIYMLPVSHQRQIGCCVGCAAAKYKQLLDYKDTGKVIPLSFRFPYALAKCQDGFSGEGTYPRLVSNNGVKVGFSTENTCPSDATLKHEDFVYQRIESNIPYLAMGEAYAGKIKAYAFVPNDKESIKQAIFNNSGLIMLVELDARWWTDKHGNHTLDKNKLLPITPPVTPVSAHEIFVYGYRETANDMEIHFLNSWSKDWADKGTGYFLYSQYKKWIKEMITFTDIPNELLEEAHNQPVVFKHNFTVPMKLGDKNDGVEALQKALTMEGLFKHEITSFYGQITQKAVYDFQVKYNMPMSAYERYILRGSKVGPKTLALLNQRYYN